MKTGLMFENGISNQKWEYLAVHVQEDQHLIDIQVSSHKVGLFQHTTETINALGEDGWELVANDKGELFFKRPK
jgi:hypothetical protein